jgi:hypothetical protein
MNKAKTNKRNVLIFIITLCTLWIASFGMMVDAYASSDGDAEWIEVQVEKGDTLWKLVSRHYQGNEDIREVINNVQQINDLQSSAITPRQWIKIPIK